MLNRVVMPGRGRTESGATLVGILLGTTVVVIGLFGLVSVLLSSSRLGRTNRDTVRASLLAKQVMERIRACPPEEVFATFNSDPADDPNGVASSPGSAFAVSTPAGQGFAQIEFPNAGLPGELREDVTDTALGMPLDLNGDGLLDTQNHAGDYHLLPVRVRLFWDGPAGPQTFEINTMILRQ